MWNESQASVNIVVRDTWTHLSLDKMPAILADDNFKCIFLNENHKIPIWNSLKFVPRSPIDNGIGSSNGLAPHICGTRERWVKI